MISFVNFILDYQGNDYLRLMPMNSVKYSSYIFHIYFFIFSSITLSFENHDLQQKDFGIQFIYIAVYDFSLRTVYGPPAFIWQNVNLVQEKYTTGSFSLYRSIGFLFWAAMRTYAWEWHWQASLISRESSSPGWLGKLSCPSLTACLKVGGL